MSLVGAAARPGGGGLRLLATLPLSLWNTVGGRIARRFGWIRTPFLPTSIDVEPIDACNFRCDHCQVTHWERKTSRLTLEQFRLILGRLPGLRRVKLQGHGEPLLNTEQLSMLEEGERRGILLNVTTNGSVYNERIGSRLAALRKTTVGFSIDGATPETFDAIRVGGDFEKVAANMADLVRRRGDNPWPRITIYTLATLRNAHELPDTVRLAKRLGVDKLVITTRLSDRGKPDMAARTWPINISRKSLGTDRHVREAEKVAAEIGQHLVVLRDRRNSPTNRCEWPWTKSYIAANGDVVPCCRIGDSSVVKMGNVFEQSFSEIWNGDEYRELRRRLANDDIPDYCRNCYGMEPVAAPGIGNGAGEAAAGQARAATGA